MVDLLIPSIMKKLEGLTIVKHLVEAFGQHNEWHPNSVAGAYLQHQTNNGIKDKRHMKINELIYFRE